MSDFGKSYESNGSKDARGFCWPITKIRSHTMVSLVLFFLRVLGQLLVAILGLPLSSTQGGMVFGADPLSCRLLSCAGFDPIYLDKDLH